MDERTLCNLSNGIVATCDGAGWKYEEVEKHCSAATKATHRHGCMFLCSNARCDSIGAADLAMKKLQKRNLMFC